MTRWGRQLRRVGIPGAAAGVTVYVALWYIPDPTAMREVLAQSVGFGGILVGFLSTAKSLLISISDTSRAMRWLRENNAMTDLVDRFMVAIIAALALSVVSLCSLAVPFTTVGHVEALTAAAFGFAAGASVAGLFDTSRLLSEILRRSYGAAAESPRKRVSKSA